MGRTTQQVSKDRLIRQFAEFLPDACILSSPEQLAPYECDGLVAYRRTPWLVVLPETVRQIREILVICHQQGIPVTARGAGTGLSGGALPLKNGVLLCLTKLNRILRVDADNRLAVVEPGVTNLAITQAVTQFGLHYAPDPSSQIACTIGGNVAENSGGVHCLKYGLTTHNILRLKIVTMAGELVTVGGHGLDGPGYDLLALLTGSEGMLGVIVEVTVKLVPQPETAQVVLAAFDRIETAGAAVAGIIAAGLIPAGLEMMDRAAIHAAEDFIHAGYPREAEAILLCEVDGAAAQVKEELDRVTALLASFGTTKLSIARSERQRQLMWAGRKAAFPAVGRISPDYYCMDGTIPRRYLAKVLAGIAELAEQYGLRVANVFHAGDGNLHPLILYNAEVPGEWEKAEQFGGDILALSIAVGGTITGEHGVGVEKINQMCLQFPAPCLMQFYAVKAAFDEKGLLNPGKAIPTLRRCAEFGAMHVHEGKLAHPELERF